MSVKSPATPAETFAAFREYAQPVIVLDDEGSIAWLNTAAEHASGLPCGDSAGLHVGEVFKGKPIEAGERRRDDAYFQALFENAQDIITILSGDGVIEYESPSVERSLGYKPSELVGRDGFELIHADDLAGVMSQFTKLIANPGINIETSFRARHKEGAWRMLEAVATNLLANPIVGGVVVNIRDITLRHHAEEHLRERTAELEQLNRFMVGRELRMIELKKEIDELRKELRAQAK